MLVCTHPCLVWRLATLDVSPDVRAVGPHFFFLKKGLLSFFGGGKDIKGPGKRKGNQAERRARVWGQRSGDPADGFELAVVTS